MNCVSNLYRTQQSERVKEWEREDPAYIRQRDRSVRSDDDAVAPKNANQSSRKIDSQKLEYRYLLSIYPHTYMCVRTSFLPRLILDEATSCVRSRSIFTGKTHTHTHTHTYSIAAAATLVRAVRMRFCILLYNIYFPVRCATNFPTRTAGTTLRSRVT